MLFIITADNTGRQDRFEDVAGGMLGWGGWRLCDTCGGVWSIRVAAPLDELCGEAVLVKRRAVDHRRVVLKGVDGGVGSHCDVLKRQPESCAPLVVHKIQV